jgi:hypothetical protein
MPGWPKIRRLVSLLGRGLSAAGDISEVADANADPAGAQPHGESNCRRMSAMNSGALIFLALIPVMNYNA